MTERVFTAFYTVFNDADNTATYIYFRVIYKCLETPAYPPKSSELVLIPNRKASNRRLEAFCFLPSLLFTRVWTLAIILRLTA